MRRERTGFTAALVLVFIFAGVSRAFGCGTDRWPPKVFGDQDVARISTTPVGTSIESLTRLQAPAALPYLRRIAPVETTVYSLAGVTLSAIQLAPDGDYELYLSDAKGNTMLAESPDPSCLKDAPLASRAAAVHRELESRFHPTLVPQAVNQVVNVLGVGFFDYVLAESGHAQNGIELHPLTDISFHGDARASRQIAASTVQSTPFSFAPSTTSAPLTLFYTYHETGAISREMDATATGTLAGQSLTYSANESGANFGWISASGTPGLTSWPAQTYTVTLYVSSANSNLRITEVKVYRVDSNAGPNTSGLAVVGDIKTSTSLGAAGAATFNVPGTAQTANSTDRIAAKFYVTNAASSSQTFAYQAGTGTQSAFTVTGSTATPTPAPTPTPTPTPSPATTANPGNYSSAILGDKPVQYFQLNDTSGSTVTDSSPTGVNGTYATAILNQPGPFIGQQSTSIEVNAGAYDVGAHLPAPNIPSGSSYSIETWVDPMYEKDFMTIWGNSGTKRLLLSSNGTLLSQFDGNFSSQRTLSVGGWHQVVFVYNASTQTQMYYIDGSPDASASLPASYASFNSPYYLGEASTAGGYLWYGNLAQHAVYPYALTAAQVQAHYNDAGYPPAVATPAPGPTASPIPDGQCNGYRWTIKTGTDSAAAGLALSPVQTTTIGSFSAIPHPYAQNGLPRMLPTEGTVYQLTNVTLSEIFHASDSDYHLLLTDSTGATMIAESPDPACAAGSAFMTQLQSVRNTINAKYSNITSSGVQVNAPVSIQGLAFFDYVPNYATDESRNGIEIHPILNICFGTNCSFTPPSSSPSPSPPPTPSPTPSPTPTAAPTPTPTPTPTPIPTPTTSPVPGAVTQTQASKSNFASSVTSTYSIPALNAPPVPGDLLLLAIGWNTAPSSLSAGPAGWTSLGIESNTGVYNNVQVFCRIAQTGDTGAGSATFNRSSNVASIEYDLSGESSASCASATEAFAAGTVNNSTTLNVTSGVPAHSGDYPIAFFDNRAYAITAIGVSWTTDATTGSGYITLTAQHGPTASTSPLTASTVWKNASYPVGAVVFVVPASATPAPSPTPTPTPTPTATPTATPSATPSPIPTPTPTPTPMPTATPTSTPTPIPTAVPTPASPPPSPSGAVMQSQASKANYATSVTSAYNIPPLSAPPAAGDLLLLAIGWNTAPSSLTAGPAGWTSLGLESNTGVYNNVQVFCRIAQSGDTGAGSATFSRSSNVASIEYDLSGENGTSCAAATEGFAVATINNGATLDVTSGSPANSADYPIAFFDNRAYKITGIGANWTSDATTGGGYLALNAQHGPASASPVTASTTWSAPSYPVGAVVFVVPASATPAPTPTPMPTPTPTSTPGATPPPSPSPTPGATPPASPSPTPGVTPAPSPAPSAAPSHVKMAVANAFTFVTAVLSSLAF